MLLQAAEDLPQVVLVGLQVLAGHQDVVQVHDGVRQVPQYLVHKTLECHSCIFKTKWHPHILKQAKRRDDGRLRDVSWQDRDLMIPLLEVQLAKHRTTSQA